MGKESAVPSWEPKFAFPERTKSQAREHASVTSALCGEMGGELEESLEAHGPSSLMCAVVSNKSETPSRTMWKVKTDTQGCPLTFSCVPWHVCACTHIHVHECNPHVTTKNKIKIHNRSCLFGASGFPCMLYAGEFCMSLPLCSGTLLLPSEGVSISANLKNQRLGMQSSGKVGQDPVQMSPRSM